MFCLLFLLRHKCPNLHISRNPWDTLSKHTSVYHRDYYISKKEFFPISVKKFFLVGFTDPKHLLKQKGKRSFWFHVIYVWVCLWFSSVITDWEGKIYSPKSNGNNIYYVWAKLFPLSDVLLSLLFLSISISSGGAYRWVAPVHFTPCRTGPTFTLLSEVTAAKHLIAIFFLLAQMRKKIFHNSQRKN